MTLIPGTAPHGAVARLGPPMSAVRMLDTLCALYAANGGKPIALNDRDLGAYAGYRSKGRPSSVQRGLQWLDDNGYITRRYTPNGRRHITVLDSNI